MCLEFALAVCTCTQRKGDRARWRVWTSNGKARNSSSSPLSTHAQLRGRIRTSKRLEQPERARRARRNLQKPWRPAASLARRTRRWGGRDLVPVDQPATPPARARSFSSPMRAAAGVPLPKSTAPKPHARRPPKLKAGGAFRSRACRAKPSCSSSPCG